MKSPMQRFRELSQNDDDVLRPDLYYEKQILKALHPMSKLKTTDEETPLPLYDDMADLINITIALSRVRENFEELHKAISNNEYFIS